jgi:hypothetical protein
VELEELKKLCEARRWKGDAVFSYSLADDCLVVHFKDKDGNQTRLPYDNFPCVEDAEFFAAVSNSIDKLIKVAEAVKHMLDGNPDKFLEDIKSLRTAIEELEE